MFKILNLKDHPKYAARAAEWFSDKWKLAAGIYYESIEKGISGGTAVPSWYIVTDSSGRIIAGAGIIDNDYHDRPDLTPNLCALFVEPEFRLKGIARSLLDRARADLYRAGIERLYLITDHTDFYERCSFEFLTMVSELDGGKIRMYVSENRRFATHES